MENEEGPTEEPTPSSPTPEVENEPSQNTPVPEGADAQTQEELPNASERTRERFQKLTEQLKEKDKVIERKSVFDEFLPQTPQQAPPQQYGPPALSQYVDQLGNVDINRFDQAMQQYHQQTQMTAQQAMTTVRQNDQRFQEREAYAKYPELNPTAKNHDEDFKQLVADRLARNWATGINKPLLEVASDVARTYAKAKTDDAVAKQAVEEFKQSQANRDQGPIEKGRAVRGEEVGVERLREMSRGGSADQQVAALSERLKRAGV